jgi:hypothetical protein
MNIAKQAKLTPPARAVPLPLGKNTSELIRSTHTEELVIALCGPIGAPLHDITDDLKRILSEEYGYECHCIRLSKLIEEYSGKDVPLTTFERAQHLIYQGNSLRQKHGASVLADLAIREIARSRQRRRAEETDPHTSARVCHIIDSIKNPEELDALRWSVCVYRFSRN